VKKSDRVDTGEGKKGDDNRSKRKVERQEGPLSGRWRGVAVINYKEGSSIEVVEES